MLERWVAWGCVCALAACSGSNSQPDATTGAAAGSGGSAATTTSGAGGGKPAGCSDMKKDGSETDVDCGGDCNPCPDGSSCAAATDCLGGLCSSNHCSSLPKIDMLDKSSSPSTGGVDVTITGDHFAGGAVVTFAGVAGQNKELQVNHIIVTTPKIAGKFGPIEVRVKNPDGGEAIAAGAFSYFLGSPGFKPGKSVLVGKGGLRDVAAADLNNDKKIDLVAVSQNDGAFYPLLGSGDGTFVVGKIVPTGMTAYAVAVGDFNNDKFADVAVVNNGAATVTVALGKGDGLFTAKTDYMVPAQATGIAAAELNGDKFLDLVVVSPGNAGAALLFGKGDGTFAPGKSPLLPRKPYGVVAADLDVDGKQDLVFTVFGQGNETVMSARGGGDGSFAKPFLSDGSDGGVGLVVADLDGDKSLDVAVAAFGLANGQGAVVTLSGKGDGAFAGGVTRKTSGPPWDVAAGDFNLDGRSDLVTANPVKGDASVLIGNGKDFAPPIGLPIGGQPNGIAVGDFNGDGKPDFATADDSGGDVAILLNSSE